MLKAITSVIFFGSHISFAYVIQRPIHNETDLKDGLASFHPELRSSHQQVEHSQLSYNNN